MLPLSLALLAGCRLGAVRSRLGSETRNETRLASTLDSLPPPVVARGAQQQNQPTSAFLPIYGLPLPRASYGAPRVASALTQSFDSCCPEKNILT